MEHVSSNQQKLVISFPRLEHKFIGCISNQEMQILKRKEIYALINRAFIYKEQISMSAKQLQRDMMTAHSTQNAFLHTMKSQRVF